MRRETYGCDLDEDSCEVSLDVRQSGKISRHTTFMAKLSQKLACTPIENTGIAIIASHNQPLAPTAYCDLEGNIAYDVVRDSLGARHRGK